jgi:hypothetical protein
VGHPEEFLLLGNRQRLAALVQGRQGAEQCGQRLAQLVGDHGQQLLGGRTGRRLARARLVGHRGTHRFLLGATARWQ